MSDEEYQWDTIEAYRLNKEIIDKFLQETFGYFDYYTEVRHYYLNKDLIRRKKLSTTLLHSWPTINFNFGFRGN